MCGIIGYTGTQAALKILLDGLDVLAYRGYDSAGVAVAEANVLRRCRAEGKLEALRRKIQGEALFSGHSGVGHTRWATHGAPTEKNAHPHADTSGEVMVVHNGIIENYAALREELERTGVPMTSETDTEVIPHLLAQYMREHGDPVTAIRAATARLTGAYALAILFASRPGEIYAVRRRSPLALARSDNGSYLASDMTALLSYSREVAYPPEGDIIRMTGEEIILIDEDGICRAPTYTRVAWTPQAAGRAGHRYYMEKELYEVPHAVEKTLAALCGERPIVSDVREILFLGCGSAYHVGLLAAATGERETGVRMRAEIASEFRYRRPVITPGTLAVAISQSGETADTLAALEEAKSRGCDSLAIVNVPSSAIARASHRVFHTQAGPEIAVATTKAYCAQALATLCLVAEFLCDRGETRRREAAQITAFCQEIQASRGHIKQLASGLLRAQDIFFIGRGADAAVCREGALKLKEITYLHAEAFDAGELKHGTISLIEEGTPVIAVMTQPHVSRQMESNIREVMARGAQVIVVAAPGIDPPQNSHVYRLPPASETFAPLLAAYVMQWIAYEVCIGRGGDPDMPRNLAKSVTVE